MGRARKSKAGRGGMKREEPTRCDQVQCPRCRHWGCPNVNGSYRTTRHELRRYRRCDACQHTFATRTVGGKEELVR